MLKKILNELSDRIKNLELCDNISLDVGDRFNVLRQIAPYGKFAALYNSASYVEFGKSFSERAKILGYKPLNFILPDFAVLNFKNVFDVIGVPEDVRAIVFFDAEMSDIALYIATIFNIPCVYIMRKPFIGDFLRSSVLFFSDNFGDFFSLSCVRRIVVDTVFIEKSVSEKEMAAHFIDFAGKALAVIDLFAYNAVNIETPIIKRALSFAKDAVISALTLNPDASEETVLRLFREDCLFGLSDYALGGDLVCNSAEYSFFRLAGKKSVALGYEFLRRAYNLYLLACDNFDPFRVPDHVLRSEKLKNLTGKDDGWFLRGFSEQTSKLNGGAVDKILTEVKDAISSLNNFAEFLQSAYRAYGESPVDFSPYIDALKSSGDLPTTFNFMTFVRERGLLE